MIVAGIVIGVVVTTVIAYFKNKSFRSVVSKDLLVVEAEVSSLKGKAGKAVALVEADFEKAETAVKSLFSKL